MHVRICRHIATAGVIAWAGSCAAQEPFPLSQVTPGLLGEGRTVFEGTRVESFEVRVLGVLENALGPRRSIILARLSGGPLASTGVLQGMSGSPVFIDGRLLGAVAYSFAFSKEPIAGITPWQDMREGGEARTPRQAARAMRSTSLPWPFSAEQLLSLLAPPAQIAPRRPVLLQGGALECLAAPLVLSGFAPEAAKWMQASLGPLGFGAVAAGGAARTEGSGPEDSITVVPGSALAVSLIQGDLDLSATGTATAVDNGRVFAFGHAFQNMGSVRLPLRRARIVSSVASVQQSWKAAVALETVGVFDQDRTTGVAGALGKVPPMVPITVSLRSSSGVTRELSFSVVDDESLSPLLTYAALSSALQSGERNRGAATVKVSGEIALSNGSVVRVADVFADEQPALKASALVAAPMLLLMANDFEQVSIRNVRVVATFDEERLSATVVRGWVEPAGPLRPGTRATLHALVRTHRGLSRTISLPLEIPSSLPPGRHTILLGNADSLTSEDQRLARDGLSPRSLGQLIRRLNELRSHGRLYARLAQATPGVLAAGERMPSLPSSIMAVLSSTDQGGPVVPLPTAPAWEGEAPLDLALEGSRSLTIVVER